MSRLKLNLFPRIYRIQSSYNIRDDQAVYLRTRIKPNDLAVLISLVALEMEALAIFTHKLDYFIPEDRTIADVLALINGRVLGTPTNTAFCKTFDPDVISEIQQCHNAFGARYDELSGIAIPAIREVFKAGLVDHDSLVWSAINDANCAIDHDLVELTHLTDVGDQWAH